MANSFAIRPLPGLSGKPGFDSLLRGLSEGVRHVGVDLAIELEQLSFSVVNRGGTNGSAGLDAAS